MNRKKKIVVFDENLKDYKEYSISTRQIVSITVVFILFITVLSFSLGSFVFLSSNQIKIRKLKSSNKVLWNTIKNLNKRLLSFDKQLKNIMQKDEQLRTALNISNIPSDVREIGFGGTELVKGLNDYANLFEKDKFNNFKDILLRVEKLNKELEFESKSYRDLFYTFRNKEDSVRYIPCIKPVPGAPITSRFGKRLHPIMKVIRMHEGVDMLANIGTPIYAPADGIVKYAGVNGSYGKFIVIDHLKGFLTRYGHLSKINVEIGQKVRRGEKIGEVGSTGLSTGPHLHYEVVYKGKHLDPAQFMIE